MGAVAEVVGDVFEPIGQAVGQVEKSIESAASEVGHFVEDTGKSVGKTVQAMADDPSKALILIAVAVLAPELAPLLWEGATIAEAAMVLNTGISLANGVPPDQIAANLATSVITQGVTSDLGISTGNAMADSVVGKTVSGVAQGRDVASSLGSAIGNTAIGSGINAGVNAAKGMDFSDANGKDVEAQDGGYYGGDAPTTTVADTKIDNDAAVSQDEIINSQVFKDAIEHGFTEQEAAAIAKGTIEGQNPTVSNPTAGSSVTVEGVASDVPETTSPITYASVSKEDLDKELDDGEIDQETYNALLPYASETSKSEQEYVDPSTRTEQIGEIVSSPIDATKPDESVPFGALNETADDSGNKIYTYDDGSTLTMGSNGEVVDVTEATDTGLGEEGTNNTLDNAMERAEDGEEEYVEEADPTSKSGFSLKLGAPKISKSKTARSGLTSKTTSPIDTTSGLDSLGGEAYGVGLTQNVSSGNPEYSLLGKLETGDPQGFAAGGSAADTQGIYDLSTTASSPFLSNTKADIMALKPGVVKGKTNYALPGYPFGQTWKLAKTGGSIENAPEGHNPQFFSEGGKGSMKNTYVKGDGDGTSDSIAAMLANGEFVIPADVVSNLGNGSNDAGAKVLDEFLRTIRAHKRKANPKGLPPDSKGALGYLATANKKVKK
jgi:hypothetical protein